MDDLFARLVGSGRTVEQRTRAATVESITPPTPSYLDTQVKKLTHSYTDLPNSVYLPPPIITHLPKPPSLPHTSSSSSRPFRLSSPPFSNYLPYRPPTLILSNLH